MPNLRRQVYVSAVLLGGCTLAAVAAAQLFLPLILRLLNTPAELMGDVSVYLRCTLAGMLFTFSYNFLASSLRAVGNTRAALWFLLISLFYNIAAAWFLVAVAKMGILGTAIATASAQLLSSLLCAVYIYKKQAFLYPRREDMRLSSLMMKETASYGAIAALQQANLFIGKLIIQRAVNALGTAAISAFTAATRIENFAQAVGTSISEAVSIFVAQNLGAGENNRALKCFRATLMVMITLGVGCSAGMMIFDIQLSSVFLGAEEYDALILCAQYLFLVGAFYLLAYIGLAFVGYFRGVGRMNIPFWGTTIQIAIRVIGTYLLVDSWGLNATALATGIGWIVIVIFHSTNYVLDLRHRRLPPASA